jgi:hypothetical protein
VPLLARPCIERYRPMVEGEQAIYYDVEEGALTKAALDALADKPRLETIACAAKAHVLAHHTPAALGHHILRTCLGSP